MTPFGGAHDVEAGPVCRAGLPRAGPVPEGARRAVLVGLLVGVFVAALDVTTAAASLPGALADPASVRSLVAGASGYLVAWALFAPVFGALADLRARRSVAILGLVFLLVGAALVHLSGAAGATAGANATGATTFLFWFRALQGVGAAGISTVALAVTADMFPPTERGLALGSVGAVWATGVLLGPLLSWLTGLDVVLGLLALGLLVARMPRLAPVADVGPGAEAPAPPGSGPVRHRVLRNAALAALFFGATSVSVAACLPIFLVEALGMPVGAAGLTLVPYAVATVVGALVAGWLGGRVEHLRDLVLVSGFVLLGAALFLSRMTTHIELWRVSLYLVMAGVGVGPALALLPLAVQNAAEVPSVGRATSAVLAFGGVGGLAGVFGMVLLIGTTLSASVARADLPHSVADGLVPAGGVLEALRPPAEGRLPGRVSDAYAELAARVDKVVRSGDTTAVRALAHEPDLPERVTIQLGEIVVAGAPRSGAPETAAVATALADEVRARGSEASAAAAVAVRDAYREASHRAYAAMLVLTILALLFTFRIPELALRRTPDRRAPPG